MNLFENAKLIGGEYTPLTEKAMINKKHLEQIKRIRQEKPSEYDGPAEVKKFVDKNYSDIEKISELLEKESSEVNKDSLKTALGMIAGMISGMGSMMLIPGIAGAVIGTVIYIASGVIGICVEFVRSNRDKEVCDEMSKIRTALKRVNTSKLPDEYKKKINSMISKIDDANTGFDARVKLN